jgi:hypothetical protein
VSEFRLQNGEPDVIQIRKVFTTKEEAKVWEDIVLRRMKLSTRSNFLNKSNNNSFRGIARFKNKQVPWNKGTSGIFSHTQKSKDAISSGLTGIKRTVEFKKLISKLHTGRIRITDGVNVKSIRPTDIIPDGWHIGSSRVIDAKISDTLSGKSKPPRTKQHSENISSSTKGKPKKKVSEARTGGRHIHNPDTKVSSYLCKGKDMPEGFVYGRLPLLNLIS